MGLSPLNGINCSLEGCDLVQGNIVSLDPIVPEPTERARAKTNASIDLDGGGLHSII